MLDHETFEVKGAWEKDRGPAVPGLRLLVAPGPRHDDHQRVGHAEHGEERLNPELLLAGKYGNALHVWDLRKRRKHLQRSSSSGRSSRWCSSCARPTTRGGLRLRGRGHQPRGPLLVDLDVVPATAGKWEGEEGHHHPGRAGRPGRPAAAAEGLRAVPPLVTDINLSLDDRFLYVSCWGTGRALHQYDVSDPFNPEAQTGSVKIGGIVRIARAPEPPDGR
jgi:methanethiol oxidase